MIKACTATKIFAAAVMLITLPIRAWAQTSTATTDPSTAASPASNPAATQSLPRVIVTGEVDSSRQETVPSLGSSSYTIDKDQINVIAQGENTSFNKLLIQSHGVAFDTYGAIHFREEDPYYRYYINGTLLPGGINGFSQDIDTRFVDSVSLDVGALPALYPEGNYGIVDILTKTGADLNGGAISMYGGSFNTLHPTVSYGNSSGGTDLYFTTTFVQDDLGLENPTPSAAAIHDEMNQYRGFVYLSHQFNNSGRFTFVFSGSGNDYQIPNVPAQGPGFDFTGTNAPPRPVNSSILNETQTEQTYYQFVAYQQTIDDFSYQISQVNRGSTVLFRPDVNGDLYFNGVAARVSNYLVSNGLQADFTDKVNKAHTLRGGMLFETQRAGANDHSIVYPTNAAGDPAGVAESIQDNHVIQAYDYAVYLQDQWSVTPKLTVNYGVRFEQIFDYTREDQVSPRLNAVYKLDQDTAIHAGYARYFDPAQLLNITSGNIARLNNTTNAPDQDTNDPVRAERSHYFDLGVDRTFLPGLKAGVDGYYKIATDQIDDGQFGAANIGVPYNFKKARIYGIEFSVDYTHDGFTAYGNFAAADGWATGIASSQFEFDANELAAINSQWVHIDQTQYFTASAGVAYTWHDTTVHADAIYGDGIRAGFVNTGKLGPNYPVNIGIEHRFKFQGSKNALNVRFDITNLLDQVYVLNAGTGIGEGAVKYGNRRGFYGGLTYEF